MITKKILGIYADRDSFHYVSVVKGISGYALKSPGHRHSPHNIQYGNSYNLLKEFLTELPVDGSRSIYLSIPRSEVFTREITLPVMPVEDALMSIKNSLAIYSHLEPDAIYYDVIVSECNGGAFHALLVYASKDEIEKYRKLFSETGHGDSLKGIFPLSYGVCALLYDGIEPNASIFSLVQDDIVEFFVKSGRTLVFSITCPADAESDKDMILAAVKSQFPDSLDTIQDLSSDSKRVESTIESTTEKERYNSREEDRTDQGSVETDNNYQKSILLQKHSQKMAKTGVSKQRRFSYLPSFEINHASAAIAPFISKIQQISLDEKPVRIDIIHPFRYIIPFICVLIIALYFITDRTNRQSIKARADLSEISRQISELENKLEPLQNKIDTLKKASRFKTDVQEFMRTRPALYTVINDIALIVPDGTWFANFTYNSRGITLRGTGTDALKTVEALRSSELFDNVMLRGSVNRRPNGDENFTLVLELKPEQADDEAKEDKPKTDSAAESGSVNKALKGTKILSTVPDTSSQNTFGGIESTTNTATKPGEELPGMPEMKRVNIPPRESAGASSGEKNE